MKYPRFVLMSAVMISMVFLHSGCSSNAKDNKDMPAAITVDVERVQLATIDQRFRYSGTIEAIESIPAAFPVAGIVDRVLVGVGDPVRKGQLLATLDDESYEYTYMTAEASHQRAVDAVKRLRPMHENGNLSDIKMVEAETGLKQTDAALQLARKNLDDCKLYARRAGIVGKRSIDPGSGVAPGVNVMTVMNIDSVYAVVSVHEREISSLQLGMPTIISISALGGMVATGMIKEIGVIADPLSRTYKVKIAIPNGDHRIRPGMICSVVVERSLENQEMIVPIEAVMVDENRDAFVYTVDMSTLKVHRKGVQRGEYYESGIGITRGLEVDEIIVVAGQHLLYENAPVIVDTQN